MVVCKLQKNSGSLYLNYKGTFSVVLLVYDAHNRYNFIKTFIFLLVMKFS